MWWWVGGYWGYVECFSLKQYMSGGESTMGLGLEGLQPLLLSLEPYETPPAIFCHQCALRGEAKVVYRWK